MKTTIHAHGIEVLMSVGILDHERQVPQRIIVDIDAYGDVPLYPSSIIECLDYSVVCNYVHGWNSRGHVDLLETLLADVITFCFNHDARITSVSVNIKKPDIIHGTDYVGVSASVSRDDFYRELSP